MRHILLRYLDFGSKKDPRFRGSNLHFEYLFLAGKVFEACSHHHVTVNKVKQALVPTMLLQIKLIFVWFLGKFLTTTTVFDSSDDPLQRQRLLGFVLNVFETINFVSDFLFADKK